MYTSFHVKNFRGFADLELNDLARINLIAGKNNVGKTALLEALFIYSGPYNPELTLTVNAFRGMKQFKVEFGKWQTRTPWDTLFPEFDTHRRIEFEGSDTDRELWKLFITLVHDIKELSLLGPITSQTDKNGDRNSGSITSDTAFPSDASRVLKLEVESKQKENTKHYLIIDTQANKHLMPPPVLPDFQTVFLSASNTIDSGDSERFSNLKRQRKSHLLLNALRIIENRIVALDYLNDGIHGDIEGIDQLVPLTAMGDGVSRLMRLILAIGHAPGGIVLIDEIENGFHYSILPDVWKAISIAARDFNVQVFATTHSIEMIRAAHEAFKDEESYDFRLHRLDRDAQNQISAVTYDNELMDAAIEANFEVR